MNTFPKNSKKVPGKQSTFKKNSVSISFIVPRRLTESSKENIKLINKYAKKEKISYEIIVSKGNSATAQRNKSANLAIYNYLYFLDNDSLLMPETLANVLLFIKRQNSNNTPVDILGGPSLLQTPAPPLQRAIATSLGSKLVVGQVAARYASVGGPRHCNEGSLILCNMIVLKKTFFEIKKFYEMLYPGEEVDFVMRAKRLNKNVFYHPQMAVMRPQRSTIGKFIFQMFNYGIGRAELTKLVPKNFNFLFLLPGILFLAMALFITFSIFYPSVFFVVLSSSLSFYFIYLAVVVSFNFNFSRATILLPATTFICHFFYGLGIAWGFVKKNYAVNMRKPLIIVEKLKKKG